MTKHMTGTRNEWLRARLELLEAEKELTRQSDELARRRQELPWVRVDKAYQFETEEGTASLADLFRGRSQLLVYHFMFGPDYKAGCPSCSAIADGFDGSVVHLANHDVTLCAVSRAPLAKLQAFKRRMGWSSPGLRRSAATSTSTSGWHSPSSSSSRASSTRTSAPWTCGRRRAPVRVRWSRSRRIWYRRGDVHPGGTGHECLCARGRRRLPHLLGVHPWAGRPLGMYQWLDRAPRGRNETMAQGSAVTTSTSTASEDKPPRGNHSAPRGQARIMASERVSDRRRFSVSAALLFAASAAVTIVWGASMSAMGGMPMPGGWTMSMAWMRMPGQTWPGLAVAFLGMWIVMMVAMMLPSLIPMLWRYRQAADRRTRHGWGG